MLVCNIHTHTHVQGDCVVFEAMNLDGLIGKLTELSRSVEPTLQLRDDELALVSLTLGLPVLYVGSYGIDTCLGLPDPWPACPVRWLIRE